MKVRLFSSISRLLRVSVMSGLLTITCLSSQGEGGGCVTVVNVKRATPRDMAFVDRAFPQ